MPYKPPYEITSLMLDYVSKIMKLIGKLTSGQGLSNKPKLRRTNKINSVYSSLAIENNKLSRDQVKDIINGKLVIGSQRDVMEVKNAIRCYDNVSTINPYSIDELLKYHKMMMEGLVEDAGRFRFRQEGVFDGDNLIFVAPPHTQVPELVHDLYDYLNHFEENTLIKSSVFHYEFEFIHPFSDGNGRMGRLFQTAILANEEEIFAYLPIESIIKERQQTYYDSIALSHQQGKSNHFIEFMLDAILETITRTFNDVKSDAFNMSIQMKKLLAVMNDDTPYTAQELMYLVGLKSRASFKRNYIDPAMDHGFINMTIPETPTSRNQRYIKIIYNNQ